jgi:alpha-beta hydrolase superfamily lysophospholipase
MKILKSCLVLIFVLALILLLAGPQLTPRIQPSQSSQETSSAASAPDIEKYIQARESQNNSIKPGFEKSILWFDANTKMKTPLAIVYIHGFSATPRDLSPVVERVAKDLGANVFFTRLKAHGLTKSTEFKSVRAQDWIDDAREALAIGRRIGNRVVLIGTSTGGLLSLYEAYENLAAKDIASLVLISPLFGLPDPRAKFISGPFGPWLARLLLGREHHFHAENLLHEQYWTTTYPSEAIASLMDLVNGAARFDLSEIKVPTLVLYTSKDTVVDIELVKKRFFEIGSQDKILIDLPEANRHEFAGIALAPQAIDPTVREIVKFIRAH